MTDSHSTKQKAELYSQRKYVLAMEKIISDANQHLAAKKAEFAARGVAQSGAMWKVVADHLVGQIEALLRAKLTTALDGYDLYQVTIDDAIVQSLLRDIREMRDAQVAHARDYPTSQPWLRGGADRYIRERLDGMTRFENEAKVEIEERRERQPKEKRAETGTLIFISCGQSTPSERELGKQIAALVERQTGYSAYFAENQANFEGVTENILKKLHKSIGFIGVMHPRGNVSNPVDPSVPPWVRGSVWVEQEVAIAAFMAQALGLSLRVKCYVHNTIHREGLRDKLMLNPELFNEDAEILEDLGKLLPSWRGLHQPATVQGVSLVPFIQSRPLSIPGGSSDSDDERMQVLVGVQNSGGQDVQSFRLQVDYPSEIVDSGGHMLRTNDGPVGFARFAFDSSLRKIDHLYPGDRTPEDLVSVDCFVRGTTKRKQPECLERPVIATAFASGMQPARTAVRIVQLLRTP